MPLFFRTGPMRVALFVLGVALCLSAGASVFKALGRNWSGWVPVGGLPWEKAYQTQMRVNGKRVEMHVYTARHTEPAADQLIGALEAIGATVQTTSSGNGGVATLNGYEVGYTISSPPSEPRHYIFLSYADPNGSEKKGFPVPLYPNGTVMSTVSDINTQVDYASVKTTDTSSQVHGFYQQRLTSEGWVQIKPCIISAGESKGLAIYGKNGKICFIDVVPNKNLCSTVSVLVEKGN